MPTTKAPIVFLLAEKDDLTPASECVAYATYLRERGADTKTIVYPGVYTDSTFPGFVGRRRPVVVSEGRNRYATAGHRAESGVCREEALLTR